MKRIYNVLVKNQSGVLCKVSGLFWRRCFNIDSLAVGETEDNAISNMTIVSTGDDHTHLNNSIVFIMESRIVKIYDSSLLVI